MCDNLDRAKRKCMGAGLYCFWDGDDIFSTSPCHCDNLCRNTSHNLQEIKRMRVRYVIFPENRAADCSLTAFATKIVTIFQFYQFRCGASTFRCRSAEQGKSQNTEDDGCNCVGFYFLLDPVLHHCPLVSILLFSLVYIWQHNVR